MANHRRVTAVRDVKRAYVRKGHCASPLKAYSWGYVWRPVVIHGDFSAARQAGISTGIFCGLVGLAYRGIRRLRS